MSEQKPQITPFDELNLQSAHEADPVNSLAPAPEGSENNFTSPELSGRSLIAPVVVSRMGEDYRVLLVRNNDRWGLPQGFIRDDETSEDAARHTVQEQTEIDATEISFKTFYRGHVGSHEKVETVAPFTVLGLSQRLPDNQKTMQWVDLDTLEKVKPGSGVLEPVHHGLAVAVGKNGIEFNRIISKAQDLFSEGKSEKAGRDWRRAIDLLVDPLEKADSLHELAKEVAKHRYPGEAEQFAVEAFNIHDRLVRYGVENVTRARALEARPASASFVGQIILHSLVVREMQGGKPAYDDGQLAIERFTRAYNDLHAAGKLGSPLDIENFIYGSIASSLYLDKGPGAGKSRAFNALKKLEHNISDATRENPNVRRAKMALKISSLATRQSFISIIQQRQRAKALRFADEILSDYS